MAAFIALKCDTIHDRDPHTVHHTWCNTCKVLSMMAITVTFISDSLANPISGGQIFCMD